MKKKTSMKMTSVQMMTLLLGFLFAVLCESKVFANRVNSDSQTMDVLEGENVLLECKFDPSIVKQNPKFFWIRTNRNGHDNVAIGESPLENNYSIDFDPNQGRYDLRIMNATYNRDNGQYECRMKKLGAQLHSKSLDLTVLLQPSHPVISPQNPVAVEGKILNLTCSSHGGSPPPGIYWYRKGQAQLLEAELIKGHNKDDPTKSILSISPSKENDGSEYRCLVWNRALKQNQKFETSTRIHVNYFPRITLKPANPLKVEKDSTVQFECSVDSKPTVNNVRWMHKARFIATTFKHTIPTVVLDDAGTYTCSADNELGQVTKADLTLDVLYGPVVSLPPRREVNEGESVAVDCKVSSNPKPKSILWFKSTDPSKILSQGHTLRLNRMSAVHNGVYVCMAANDLKPSGSLRVFERIGNATIEINVRHRPGKSFVIMEEPFAVDGRSVTLRCGADPPGYPNPSFTWWKEGTNRKTISVGQKLTLQNVKMTSAGIYSCQPTNELGSGSVGSATLEVHQAPKIITHLQPKIVKQEGDSSFHVSCSATGKPRPKIKWIKNGKEIIQEESSSFQISTKQHPNRHQPDSSLNVESTLKFIGAERILKNQLMPQDKGMYMCVFENDVGSTESSMLLKIEHAPLVVHQHNKVAYDVNEVAVLTCQMQAYPEPRFEWTWSGHILQNGHYYRMNKTKLSDDIFEATISIAKVSESSYGEYTCKGVNKIGQKKTIIKLQRKGKPDNPVNIRPIYSSYDTITLAWDNGFDGGFKNTTFTIEYLKNGNSHPRYKECGTQNPCNISDLEQHTQYNIRVKAANERGESKYSEMVAVATKVDITMIPKPENVYYEKLTSLASFQVEKDAQLQLIAKLELENNDGTWRHYMTMQSSDFGGMVVQGPVSNLRVRLCLETNELLCGPYAEALVVDVRRDATISSSSSPWLIAVVIAIIVLAFVALIIAIKCFCSNRTKTLKNDDINSNHPTIIHGSQPPAYNSTFGNGIENKGVEGVKDVSDDNIKANLFSTSNGYVYHSSNGENSNSNSANGGSVNSQDSLWNVKSNNNPTDMFNQQQLQQQAQPSYQNGYIPYDQMLQQQQQPQQTYTEDYSHYPYPEEYLSDKNRPYLGSNDPFQGMNHHHADYTPFGDMGGLPNPYTNGSLLNNPQDHNHIHHQQPQQQQQQQGAPMQVYDESIGESGYSTPTSKNKRIVREIIV